jgi:hypothetical protein
MADNFNLRAFLTENKLTKNSQLLKEGDDYKYFDEEGTGGFYMTTIDGVKIYSLEDSSIMDTCFYALEDEDGYIDFISIDVSGEPISSEDIQNEQEISSYIADFIEEDINSQLEEEGLLEASGSMKNKVDEARYSDSYDSPASKEVHAQLSRISLKDLDAAIAKAEEETGTKVSDLERRVLTNQKHWMNTMDMEMERESVKNKKPVMEANLTAKERRLVEMVQDALNAEGYGDDNVNLQRKKQGLPPAQGPKYSEAVTEEEMTDETVIPEYRTIDELMKSIDHGTNEVAEKHKMEQMKKIAEALRMKAKKMEESEHAAHISPKDLKQLATDAAKLEKAAEKLKAAFDKKFNKKEKPAAAAKTEKVEALQEGFFDLRKFLAENRK